MATSSLASRYSVGAPFARGGMATLQWGRPLTPEGTTQWVAIKRLHHHLALDPDCRAMFLDEGRLSAAIRHPNIVAVLDVFEEGDDLSIVMEYIEGETIHALARKLAEQQQRAPVPIAARLASDALRGLHAAHETRSAQDEPLHIVHRDVSPQNILVGTDGITRVLDFGIAKAAERIASTREGQLKGKLSYMSPEQMMNAEVDRRSDVFALGIVLWEMLAGRRLIEGKNDGACIKEILFGRPVPLRPERPEVSPELEAVVMRALQRDPNARFATAEQMRLALESAVTPIADDAEVSQWLRSIAGSSLRQRNALQAVADLPPAAPPRVAVLPEGFSLSQPTVTALDAPPPSLPSPTAPLRLPPWLLAALLVLGLLSLVLYALLRF